MNSDLSYLLYNKGETTMLTATSKSEIETRISDGTYLKEILQFKIDLEAVFGIDTQTVEVQTEMFNLSSQAKLNIVNSNLKAMMLEYERTSVLVQ